MNPATISPFILKATFSFRLILFSPHYYITNTIYPLNYLGLYIYIYMLVSTSHPSFQWLWFTRQPHFDALSLWEYLNHLSMLFIHLFLFLPYCRGYRWLTIFVDCTWPHGFNLLHITVSNNSILILTCRLNLFSVSIRSKFVTRLAYYWF